MSKVGTAIRPCGHSRARFLAQTVKKRVARGLRCKNFIYQACQVQNFSFVFAMIGLLC